ncbi:MAG TPA: ABC transporter ATP-binding protein [Pirellulales bacterium]|jgi:branched-chain amino acid transport system ATP-binding protein|nr:ABC transporter ATP-binding protein [Pirellulales bacterium]
MSDVSNPPADAATANPSPRPAALARPLLKVESLHAGYGPIEVLKGISFEVRTGEIVTLIGANGAGKTSTLMCLSGCVPCRQGTIEFNGQKIQNRPAHEIVRLGMSQSPEGRKIFPRLSVLENLNLGAYTKRNKPEIQADIERAYELFPILKQRGSQLGGTLSGGEQQMLAVARALMSRPKLLLLDEPSLGLAPLIVLKIFDVLRDLNRAGMAVLLVEQNARMALKLAQRAYVLETGSITRADRAETLLHDPKIQDAYLGE